MISEMIHLEVQTWNQRKGSKVSEPGTLPLFEQQFHWQPPQTGVLPFHLPLKRFQRESPHSFLPGLHFNTNKVSSLLSLLSPDQFPYTHDQLRRC